MKNIWVQMKGHTQNLSTSTTTLKHKSDAFIRIVSGILDIYYSANISRIPLDIKIGVNLSDIMLWNQLQLE